MLYVFGGGEGSAWFLFLLLFVFRSRHTTSSGSPISSAVALSLWLEHWTRCLLQIVMSRFRAPARGPAALYVSRYMAGLTNDNES